eukprot:365665-Chlamydomonas_euryale.AAC.2
MFLRKAKDMYGRTIRSRNGQHCWYRLHQAARPSGWFMVMGKQVYRRIRVNWMDLLSTQSGSGACSRGGPEWLPTSVARGENLPIVMFNVDICKYDTVSKSSAGLVDCGVIAAFGSKVVMQGDSFTLKIGMHDACYAQEQGTITVLACSLGGLGYGDLENMHVSTCTVF